MRDKRLTRVEFFFSLEGRPLTWMLAPESVPILTVELTTKWYDLWVINPDRTVHRIPLAVLDSLTNLPAEMRHRAKYVDNVPDPRAMRLLAEQQGWILDELAYELVTGRWELEINHNSVYPVGSI